MQHVHRALALDEVDVRVLGDILNDETGSLDLAHGDDAWTLLSDGRAD